MRTELSSLKLGIMLVAVLALWGNLIAGVEPSMQSMSYGQIEVDEDLLPIATQQGWRDDNHYCDVTPCRSCKACQPCDSCTKDGSNFCKCSGGIFGCSKAARKTGSCWLWIGSNCGWQERACGIPQAPTCIEVRTSAGALISCSAGTCVQDPDESTYCGGCLTRAAVVVVPGEETGTVTPLGPSSP